MTGDSEFALRAFSALASVLGIALTYALGARLFGRAAGLIAALLIALNSFSIFYAQETRMYALLALVGAASMWALVNLIYALEREEVAFPRRQIILLGVFNALGMYTHYAFAFVLLAQGIIFVLWLALEFLRGDRDVARRAGAFAGANLLALVAFAPWLPEAYNQITTWPSTGESVPFPEASATILAYLAFGITVGTGTTIGIAFFLLFGQLYEPGGPTRERRWALIVPSAWVVASVAAFLLLGLFREANLKFLLPAQLGFALWVGRGVRVVWELKPRDRRLTLLPQIAAGVGLIALVVTLWGGLNALYHDAAYQRDDYRAIAATIEARLRPDDAIILNAPGQAEVFGYYYAGAAPVYPLPPGLGGDDAESAEATRAVINAHDRIFLVLWGTDERDPGAVVQSLLGAEAYEARSDWFGDVRLVRYAAGVMNGDEVESGAVFQDAAGSAIMLESYTFNDTTVAPGDMLQLRLNWRADELLDARYVVFVQLLNEDGVLVAQRDSEPGAGRMPTHTWEPGARISDHHALIVPDDLPETNYALIIGLYNPDDPMARLPVTDIHIGGPQDHLLLARISVTDDAQREAEQ